MRRKRLLVSVLVVALAALSMGTATAWLADSATVRFEITAADDFGPDLAEKVWVCKLVGPPDNPIVKPGRNPIHVPVDSIDAEEGFSDAHPSYVVDSRDVVCEVPDASEAPEEAQPVVDSPTIEETPDLPGSTTTTTVAEDTTTTMESTTTTAESAATTTVSEAISTTTSTAPDNDE